MQVTSTWSFIPQTIRSFSPILLSSSIALSSGCVGNIEEPGIPESDDVKRGLLLSPPEEDGTPGVPLRDVTYQVIDGKYIAEGDMIIPENQLVELSDEEAEALEADGGAFGEDGEQFDEDYGGQTSELMARAYRRMLWPRGVVPYVIGRYLPRKARVRRAIRRWNRNTPIKLVPRRGQRNYVAFVRNRRNIGWSEGIGRIGGRQRVLLGDGVGTPIVMHEIGHVVGLFHEQTRPDRDRYIRVHWRNIKPGARSQFYKATFATRRPTRYDPYSIMHYPAYWFSSNGWATMTFHNGRALPARKYGLSRRDKIGLRRLY